MMHLPVIPALVLWKQGKLVAAKVEPLNCHCLYGHAFFHAFYIIAWVGVHDWKFMTGNFININIIAVVCPYWVFLPLCMLTAIRLGAV